MGRMLAEEIVNTAELSIEQQLEWHLRGNHYPPVPVAMVSICRDVIDHVNKGGDINAHYKMPEGSTWRGQKSAPAWAIIEGHHLESWILNEEDFWEDNE